AGTLIFGVLTVDTLGDIRGLFADDIDHATGVGVVTDLGGGVADVLDHAAHQVFQIDPGAGGDFATDDGNPGFHHGFAGHAGIFVLAEDGVQHGVGNLVSQLVRMAFGDRFRGENRVVAHSHSPFVNRGRLPGKQRFSRVLSVSLGKLLKLNLKTVAQAHIQAAADVQSGIVGPAGQVVLVKAQPEIAAGIADPALVMTA